MFWMIEAAALVGGLALAGHLGKRQSPLWVNVALAVPLGVLTFIVLGPLGLIAAALAVRWRVPATR